MMVLGQGIASVVGIIAQYVVLFTGDNNLADFFLAIVVGNLVQFFVMLFVLAISRYREYVADSDAKGVIGRGDPLARALEKIQQGNERSQDDRLDENVSALHLRRLEEHARETRLHAPARRGAHPPPARRWRASANSSRSRWGAPRVGLVAAPRTAIRLSVFMGPHRRRRHGEYGGEDNIPTARVYVARALGVACIAVAGVIAYQTYA